MPEVRVEPRIPFSAVQYTGDNVDELLAFSEGLPELDCIGKSAFMNIVVEGEYRDSLEIDADFLKPGMWVVKIPRTTDGDVEGGTLVALSDEQFHKYWDIDERYNPDDDTPAHNIFDAAFYIVFKSGLMSPRKLEMLCYYAQAWSIAWDSKALFAEDFEAWGMGPVCPELHARFAATGVVTEGDLRRIPGKSTDFSKDIIETLDTVIQDYAYMSGSSLSELAKSERPYRDARGDFAPGEIGDNKVISKESMWDYYLTLPYVNGGS